MKNDILNVSLCFFLRLAFSSLMQACVHMYTWHLFDIFALQVLEQSPLSDQTSNSTTTAIVVSVLIIALVAVVLVVIYYRNTVVICLKERKFFKFLPKKNLSLWDHFFEKGFVWYISLILDVHTKPLHYLTIAWKLLDMTSNTYISW